MPSSSSQRNDGPPTARSTLGRSSRRRLTLLAPLPGPLASDARADPADGADPSGQVLALGSCFAHTCGLVPDMSDRIAGAGYFGWSALGAWLQSSGQRANILNASFTDIGIGVAITRDGYERSWVKDFGAR
jgi:hypothetical protein